MFDEILGCLNTSANNVDIAHAFSLKKIARTMHCDRGSQSQMYSSFTAYSNHNLHRNVGSNVGSFEHLSQHLSNLLAEMLGEMLDRLNRP